MYQMLVGGSIIPDLVNGIKMYFTMLAAFFGAIMAVIKAVLVGAWNVIRAVVMTVITVISTVVRGGMMAIQMIIRAVMAAIQGNWRLAWALIMAAVKVVVATIRAVIVAWISGVRAVISAGLNAIRATFSAVWNGIKAVVSTVLSGIRSTISSGMASVRSTVSSGMNSVKSIWSSAWGALTGVVSRIMGSVSGIVSGAVGRIGGLISGITSKISAVRDKLSVLPGLSKGGLVPGTGNRDTFPAALTPGEFVLTKTVVKRIGIGMLNRINRSSRPLEEMASGTGNGLVKAPPGAPVEVRQQAVSNMVNLANFAVSAPKMDGAGEVIDNSVVNVNTTVVNPLPERASETVQSRLSRSAQLGLIGGRRTGTEDR